jgi:hypothetical protein
VDFSELIDELQARGFSYLSDTRAGQYINWARSQLDDMYLWPYRETSVTGTSALSISDLGTIEAVLNTTQQVPLQPADYRSLLEWHGDLSVSGDPVYYYVAWPSGTPTVATYPSNSDTIGVQYYKVTADLTGTDDPAAPTRFHGLIVDLAAAKAYRDSDNFQAAEALQADINRQVAVMVDALFDQTIQGPSAYQQITYSAGDW